MAPSVGEAGTKRHSRGFCFVMDMRGGGEEGGENGRKEKKLERCRGKKIES